MPSSSNERQQLQPLMIQTPAAWCMLKDHRPLCDSWISCHDLRIFSWGQGIHESVSPSWVLRCKTKSTDISLSHVSTCRYSSDNILPCVTLPWLGSCGLPLWVCHTFASSVTTTWNASHMFKNRPELVYIKTKNIYIHTYNMFIYINEKNRGTATISIYTFIKKHTIIKLNLCINIRGTLVPSPKWTIHVASLVLPSCAFSSRYLELFDCICVGPCCVELSL